MRHRVLRTGVTGPDVRDLQMALNARLNPSPNLMVNGSYDARTLSAVLAFQAANWLETDGIAGACTLDALHETEATRPILHPVRFLPQPAEGAAWAAAIAMLKAMPLAAVLMRPGPMNPARPAPESPLPTRHDATRLLAQRHGLHHYPPQPWPVEPLIALLAEGPLAMELAHNPRAFGPGAGGVHFWMILGARGSHESDGNSTTFRVFDPWPVGRGQVQSLAYPSLLRQVPQASFGLLAR